MAGVLEQGHRVMLNAISYFETKRGLHVPLFRRKLETFRVFTELYGVLPLDMPALDASATIYRDLRDKGTPLEDADVLIAGIALARDAVLVTRNLKHFERIDGLRLETWEDV